MSQGVITKGGKVYVVRFYSKKWGQNAFYRGMVAGEPKYTKELKNAKKYIKPGNANNIADQLTAHTRVVHRLGIKY
jgi:hypothetical protein